VEGEGVFAWATDIGAGKAGQKKKRGERKNLSIRGGVIDIM